MARKEVFFPNDPMLILSIALIGLPRKNQEKSIGVSPDKIPHCTDIDAPIGKGSSPNVNGKMFGKAICKKKIIIIIKLSFCINVRKHDIN